MTARSDVPPASHETLARALSEAAGISLSSVLGRNVEAGLRAAASLLGISQDQLVLRLGARDPASVVALLESVLVHESHFFRHPDQLEGLKEIVARTPRDRPLSLWSAGCAAGEEAYTIAMVLAEAGRDGCPDRIVATDVSMQAIAAAREAVYGDWSLRQLSPERRVRFFSDCGGELARVSDAIRGRVEFRVHELVNHPPPGEGFDVVLCRNVLVYLAPAPAERVLRKMVEALAPGGFLVVAPAELGFTRGLPLEKTEVGTAVLLRKPPTAPPAPRPAVARPHAARARRGEDDPARRVPAARPAPAAAASPPPASAPPAAPPRSAFEEAHEAARRGDLEAAERLAREVASREQRADAYLLLSAAADARGDLAAAARAAKQALYLDPGLAQAHAALVGIFRRLGRPDDARRSRRNAIALLEGLDDLTPLPGLEEITAGALRGALLEVHP